MAGVQVSGDSGPIFDGTAEKTLSDGVGGIAKTQAEDLVNEIRNQLDTVLQNPTGNYSDNIRDVEEEIGTYSINDNDVVYGPWLEGIGTRNATSSFKGYHTFELVGARMESKVESGIEDGIDELLSGLE